MTKKYHNHTLQTNSPHSGKETQNTNIQIHQEDNLSKPSLPQQDDCKTIKGTKSLSTAYEMKDQKQNTNNGSNQQ